MPGGAGVTTGKKRSANDRRQRHGHATASRRDETSAGGVVCPAKRSAEPLFLLIRDSYQNWGFPRGTRAGRARRRGRAARSRRGDRASAKLQIRAPVETIDWCFRFRGRLIHKVCDFFLMEADRRQRHQAAARRGHHRVRMGAAMTRRRQLVSYANARAVLARAHATARQRAIAAPATTGSLYGMRVPSPGPDRRRRAPRRSSGPARARVRIARSRARSLEARVPAPPRENSRCARTADEFAGAFKNRLIDAVLVDVGARDRRYVGGRRAARASSPSAPFFGVSPAARRGRRPALARCADARFRRRARRGNRRRGACATWFCRLTFRARFAAALHDAPAALALDTAAPAEDVGLRRRACRAAGAH